MRFCTSASTCECGQGCQRAGHHRLSPEVVDHIERGWVQCAHHPSLRDTNRSQLGVTLLILWRCLKEYRPRQLGLFPVRWRGSWPLVVLLCCGLFPAVDWVAQESMGWFQTDADQWSNQVWRIV